MRSMSLASSASYRAAAELPDRDDEPTGPRNGVVNCMACGKFAGADRRVWYTPDSDRSVETIEVVCPACDEADRKSWEARGISRPY